MPISPAAEALLKALDNTAKLFASQVGELRASLAAEPVPTTPPVVTPPPVVEPPPPVVEPPPIEVGTTIIRTPAELQQALDNAPGGSILRLDPTATFTGNFRLRKKATPTGLRTVVRPHGDAPAPGAKPWITTFAGMPKIGAADATQPALDADDGAADYQLFGLDFVPNTALPDRDLVQIGRNEMTALEQMPANITVERCWFHGSDAKGGHCGLRFNVKGGKVLGSYFEKFVERGRDSQAISIISGAGPYLIEGNYLEASGENIMVGGADVRIKDLVPSDITFRGNHFFKPTAWRSQGGSVKNLFELKNARRVVVENNVFENCWVDAQSGNGVVFTVRNQDGGNPWATVDDVNFRYNVIRNCEGYGINSLGQDYLQASRRGVNMAIKNNLILNCASGIMLNRQMQPTWVEHNTLLGLVWKFLQFAEQAVPMASGSLYFRNNVVSATEYGAIGEGTAPGTLTISGYAPGARFTHNVIEQGGTAYSYPTGNYLKARGGLTVVDYKYTGTEASHDGAPMGCDVDELRRRIPWYVL